MDFEEAERLGMVSTTFAGGRGEGDGRAGFTDAAYRVAELMAGSEETEEDAAKRFDDARYAVVREQMIAAGIDPDTGLPVGETLTVFDSLHGESGREESEQGVGGEEGMGKEKEKEKEEEEEEGGRRRRKGPGFVKVLLLIDLGFEPGDAVHAMRSADNNVAQALLLLLQQASPKALESVDVVFANQLLETLQNADMESAKARAIEMAQSLHIQHDNPTPASSPLIDFGEEGGEGDGADDFLLFLDPLRASMESTGGGGGSGGGGGGG